MDLIWRSQRKIIGMEVDGARTPINHHPRVTSPMFYQLS